MTENNNFLISNKRHCENFRERKKKEKRKKSQNIFLRNYFRYIRKNSGETFARNFSQLSGIVNSTIRGIHVSKRSKATITFVSTKRLISLIPERIRKGPILKSIYKMNHRWDLRISRRIPHALSILSSTCTRRRVRVAQFSREDCSYHPFETTTTTTRLRPLD